MPKKQIVGSMSDWSGVLKDLYRQFDDGSITLSHIKALVEHKNPFEINAPDLLEDWSKFYQDVFGLELDFSGITIPERRHGFGRLLVIAQGMTPQRLFNKCKELFPSWKYTNSDLDKVIKSDRTSQNGHYAIWVRDRQEADEENKDLSADFLKERGTPEITLEERELYELKFFKETADHLDKEKITLCPGSRYSDGNVPSADWSGDRFGVGWYYAVRHDSLRSRSVVS